MGWVLGKLRSYLALPPADRRQTLRALTALPMVVLGLRWLGYGRCHRWLLRLAPEAKVAERRASRVGTEALREKTQSVVRAVRLAERNLAVPRLFGHALFPVIRCLERSLTLWWLLARDHVPAQLRIGVRRAGEGIEAHAWVEVMGLPLDDADIGERYLPFAQPLSGEKGVTPVGGPVVKALAGRPE